GEFFKIFCWFYFQLDALKTRRDLNRYFFAQYFGICLQANRNATRNLRSRSAQQFAERKFFLLRFDIPKSVFEAGAGHFMPANALENGGDVRGSFKLLTQDRRGKGISNKDSRGAGRFRIGSGRLPCRGFSPP